MYPCSHNILFVMKSQEVKYKKYKRGEKMKTKKRADGRYSVQIYLGREDGKRRYKTVYGATQREANEKAEKIRAQMGKGLDLTADDTFGFWCEAFVQKKKNEVGVSQANAYRGRLHYFTRFNLRTGTFDFAHDSELANTKITEVKLWQLQRILDELAEKNPFTKKPTAKRTLASIRRAVVDVFAYAIMNRVTDFNTAAALTIRKGATVTTRRALTKEEQDRVRTFPHRAQLPAMLAMLAGLRRGEMTALLWSDVDFENGVIRVTKSYDFKNGETKLPKTDAGNRVIPMVDELAEFLKAQKKTSVFVVTSCNGNRMTETAWRAMLDSYLADLNIAFGKFTEPVNKFQPGGVPFVIKPFTWHCLRHTFATMLYDADVDVLTAQKLLGHADSKTTLSIYTHLSKEKEKMNIDKFNIFLKNSDACQMHVKNAENR